MNFKEKAKEIINEAHEKNQGVPNFGPTGIVVTSDLIEGINAAINAAYEAGKAESKELIETLMVEKNNMLPPYEHTKMRELWEEARNHREELMKKWRG
jgi:cysteine sulfinate desulfinase/cysteine desulfurase-like protein